MSFQGLTPPLRSSQIASHLWQPHSDAGNAPGLDTGASAILIMSEGRAREKGLKPLAKILSMVATATTPRLIAAIPGFTIQKALEKAQRTLDQVDLIEINEAFAAMPLVSAKIWRTEIPKR